MFSKIIIYSSLFPLHPGPPPPAASSLTKYSLADLQAYLNKFTRGHYTKEGREPLLYVSVLLLSLQLHAAVAHLCRDLDDPALLMDGLHLGLALHHDALITVRKGRGGRLDGGEGGIEGEFAYYLAHLDSLDRPFLLFFPLERTLNPSASEHPSTSALPRKVAGNIPEIQGARPAPRVDLPLPEVIEDYGQNLQRAWWVANRAWGDGRIEFTFTFIHFSSSLS